MHICVKLNLVHVYILPASGSFFCCVGIARPQVLIRLRPLPDELIRGYRGRLMRLNGMLNDKQFDTLLREWAGIPGSDYREVPQAILLAKTAGMSITEFVSQHSFVPLRRAITWFRPETKHGCESEMPLLWSGPMHLPRDGAYFCEHCVAEDLERNGMGYWRRTHQIPGVFWCSEHRGPLRYMAKASAFQRPPSIFLDTAIRVSHPWVEELTGNSYLQRYADICSSLLERNRPFDVAVVSQVLKAEARVKGFQVSGPPVKRPLLSDMAIAVLGRQWLATVIPALANKPLSEISHQVDGACYLKKSSSTVAAYALVCSLLYSSAEKALNALAGMSPQDLAPRRKRNVELPIEDLVDAYVQARGDYGLAAKRFECVYQTVVSRYVAMGLPNFSGKRGARLFDSAIAFFVEEKSWADSILAGSVTPEEMENMIRGSGGGLGGVLKEIRSSQGPELATKRPRRLSPQDAQHIEKAMSLSDMASG